MEKLLFFLIPFKVCSQKTRILVDMVGYRHAKRSPRRRMRDERIGADRFIGLREDWWFYEREGESKKKRLMTRAIREFGKATNPSPRVVNVAVARNSDIDEAKRDGGPFLADLSQVDAAEGYR